ncbi:MAG TPA: PAS domain S-box protein [Solirubrobacteraceae bacterium]|jgi:PAS domain S-box-containing protein|nr:PAS domain S-box protein [Solirubrobacteraceae bacterium]
MCPLAPHEIAGLGFEEIVRSAPVAMAVIDTYGRVIYSNARALEMTTRQLGAQVPPDLDDGIDIFHPDGRLYEREEWPAVRSLTSGEEIVEEEFFYVLADGARLFIRASSSPVRDKHGEIVAAVVTMYDITERRRRHEQLAYHASLLENVGDAVIATDREFRLTAWNKGAERLYGCTAEEVLGRDVRKVGSPPDDPPRVRLDRELLATGRVHTEVTAYRKDGTPFEVEVIAAAVRDADDELTGYIGIHRDVSERRRIEKRLAVAVRQQALIAELTLRNIANGDRQQLMDDAVALVGRTLELELCAIAEVLPGGGHLSWRAAFGWSPEALAVAAPSPATAGTLVGYTLLADGPVISENVNADERFLISDLFAAENPASAIAVVIPGQTQRFGVLAAASRQRRSFTTQDMTFMQSVANVVGAAIERGRVLERMEEVREGERRRIARDLHDDALSELTEAIAQAILARSAGSREEDQSRWVALIAKLQRVSQQLRGAIYDLRLSDADRPFRYLLTDLVAIHAAMATDVEIRLEGATALSSGSLGSRGTEVLRILGEALTNARGHSGATTITVDAGASSVACLLVKVSDDGQGQDRPSPTPPPRGTGIIGMIERADLLGADLQIESRPGGGTVVSVELDLGGYEAGG